MRVYCKLNRAAGWRLTWTQAMEQVSAGDRVGSYGLRSSWDKPAYDADRRLAGCYAMTRQALCAGHRRYTREELVVMVKQVLRMLGGNTAAPHQLSVACGWVARSTGLSREYIRQRSQQA